MKMKWLGIFLLSFVLLFFPSNAFAHVVVTPNQAGIASLQTFSVAVPVEKDIPTVSLRLIIPEGVTKVTPNVKNGWVITTKTEGEGKDQRISEIEWTGNSIPVGQKDDFLFSAQVPPVETTVHWKAYQTYSDGSVDEWIQDEKTQNGSESEHPASTTKVINNLQSMNSTASQDSNNGSIALGLSAAALAISILGTFQRRKYEKVNIEVKRSKRSRK